MELKLFKTMWGFTGDFENACIEAKQSGFDGIEGSLPSEAQTRAYWKECLDKYELSFICEIVTGGGYVPLRHLSPQEHLNDIESALKNSVEFVPLFATCIGGCDAWSEDESVKFFKDAIALAKSYEIEICFETHRSRSLFTPWITRRVVEAIPEIFLTADISHWCVVCERQMESELDTISAIAPNVRHIHARVGYDQGPQVPHPAAPEYKYALIAHQKCWEIIWDAQQSNAREVTTMTPEFGPDGYLHTLPFTGAPVADLWEINCWMADTQRTHFKEYEQRSSLV
ncbi:TIM barrel protein [bacterium]|nr:TIM barrel protein [bacterium]MBU1435450.1 TIM barrel protein [bacterium]MBU1502626.1 TIM barrel protein [bacterium]